MPSTSLYETLSLIHQDPRVHTETQLKRVQTLYDPSHTRNQLEQHHLKQVKKISNDQAATVQ